MPRPFRLLLIALMLAAVPAQADSDGERARAALERGEIRPLDAVLAAAKTAVPGTWSRSISSTTTGAGSTSCASSGPTVAAAT